MKFRRDSCSACIAVVYGGMLIFVGTLVYTSFLSNGECTLSPTNPDCIPPLLKATDAIRVTVASSIHSTKPLGPEALALTSHVALGETSEFTIENASFPVQLRRRSNRDTLHLQITLVSVVDGVERIIALKTVPMTTRCSGRSLHPTPRRLVGSAANESENGTHAGNSTTAPSPTTSQVSGKCWRPFVTLFIMTQSDGLGINPLSPPTNVQRSDIIVVSLGGSRAYLPLVRVDEADLQSTDYVPLSVDESRPSPSFKFVVQPLSLSWWSLQTLYTGVIHEYRRLQVSDLLVDELIYMFSRKRLRATLIDISLSYVHSFFAMLAFRNDIAFFNQNQIHRGVSRTSLVAMWIQSLITFLYLHDQPSIHHMVLIMQGITTVIGLWKIVRAVRHGTPLTHKRNKAQAPSKGTNGPSFGVQAAADDALVQPARSDPVPPAGDASSANSTSAADFSSTADDVADKGKFADDEVDEESTLQARYDLDALKYIGSVCAALFVGYAFWALHTYEYRGWWSWFITCAAHASYTWGFVLMTPQLYVNYKLKSVAHLPWRSLVYKAFSTFVDDIYALLVDVPLAYRIACCRDDIVFLILLYQLWLYPTDKTRFNEFGRAYAEKKAVDSVETKATPSSEKVKTE